MKKKFMTFKSVEAEELSRLEYVDSRGWQLPEDEDADEKVMRIVYPDGYVSMCPKETFMKQSVEVSPNGKITDETVDKWMSNYTVETVYPFGKPTTNVYVKLPTGAILIDSTTCVDPKNYDEEIGKKVLLRRLREKVWFTLGMMLQAATFGTDNIEK